MATFAQAYPGVLNVEKGYVNDPRDPGGETRWGITKRDYPHLDIPNLTREQALEIYKAVYWDPLKLDGLLDQRVANKLLDMSVNMGAGQAAAYFQRALNYVLPGRPVAVDGKIGPMTLAQANALPATADRGPSRELLWLALCAYAAVHYVDLVEGPNPNFDTFARGWLVRALGHAE